MSDRLEGGSVWLVAPMRVRGVGVRGRGERRFEGVGVLGVVKWGC